LLVADLLWFGHGIVPQCDPELYYPPVPVLARLSEAPPGRVLGMACLPPVLNQTHHLHDVRGYDAVDPARLIDLLTIARDKNYPDSPAYAATQYYIPKVRFTPDGAIEAPPVMNMLNVRYFIFRGSPEPFIKPMLQDFDYWILENKEALPRVYVPARVEVVIGKPRPWIAWLPATSTRASSPSSPRRSRLWRGVAAKQKSSTKFPRA
jgi:hypothetical protein